MKRVGFVLLALGSILFLDRAPAQEKVGMPTVAWHGQSFFMVKSSKGTALAIDPHLIPAYGRPEGLKADAVVMSHLHSDHVNIFALDNAKDKNLKLIFGLSGNATKHNWVDVNEKVKDIAIRSVPTYHDEAQGLMRGKNTVFCLEIDGWRFCHLGDLGHPLTEDQLKKIGDVDVLMIPVGGVYTLNGPEAKKVVEQIKPKEYIFPMHYATKVFDDLLPIDEFLEDVEPARVAVSDDNKVTLNKDAQRPRPLIVQLNYEAKRK